MEVASGPLLVLESLNYLLNELLLITFGELSVSNRLKKHLLSRIGKGEILKVRLSSLPQGTFVQLEDKFRVRFFEKLHKVTGSWAAMARCCDTSEGNVYHYIAGKIRVPLSLAYRLTKIIGLPNRELENHIVWVGSRNRVGINKPKTMFRFGTPEGAKFIMAILCDGALGRDPRPTYYNFNPILRRSIAESARKIFGEVQIYELPTYGMLRFPKIIGCVLSRIGIPTGDETLRDPHIPSFIRYGKKPVLKSALRQILDDEGSIDEKYGKIVIHSCKDITDLPKHASKRRYAREQRTYAPNILKDTAFILERLGIEHSELRIDRLKSTSKERLKLDWVLTISGYINLVKILHINPTHPKKRTALSEYLNNLSRAGDFQSLNRALASFSEILSKVPYVTSKDLAGKMNVTQSHAEVLLKRLRRSGFVKLIEEREKPTKFFKHDFTEKGRKEAVIQSKFF